VATGAISSAALMQSGEVYTWVRTATAPPPSFPDTWGGGWKLTTTHSRDPDIHLCYSQRVRLAIQGGNKDHQLGQGDDRNQATLRYTRCPLLPPRARAQTLAEHFYFYFLLLLLLLL
jgi:hypothetical protein